MANATAARRQKEDIRVGVSNVCYPLYGPRQLTAAKSQS